MRSNFAAFFIVSSLLVAPAWADENAPAKHKITQADSFIMIEPMYTTVVDAGRPEGMLMVAIGLDIPDPVLRGQADHGMPVLRDAYLRSLMTYSAAVVRPYQQPDVALIAARLQRVTDKQLGRSGAHVLLAQVALQAKQ